MKKLKPCTKGPRHSWAWEKNVFTSQIGTRSATLSLKGIYVCACGAKKVGDHNPNHPELIANAGGATQEHIDPAREQLADKVAQSIGVRA